MLDLSDPRWGEIKSNYGNGPRVAELLSQAYSAESAIRWYDELVQELCHQYTVTEAAYTAAPHQVKLASSPDAPRKELLVQLGVCYTFSTIADQAPLPTVLEEEWLSVVKLRYP